MSKALPVIAAVVLGGAALVPIYYATQHPATELGSKADKNAPPRVARIFRQVIQKSSWYTIAIMHSQARRIYPVLLCRSQNILYLLLDFVLI